MEEAQDGGTEPMVLARGHARILLDKRDTAQAPAHDVDAERKLRRRHNEKTPIYRLPTEILSLIFEAVDSEWRTGHHLQPFTLGSVSKRWRDVALKTPKIWAELAYGRFRTRAHVNFYLDRSRMAPLHVAGMISDDELGQALLPHAHRVKSLELHYVRHSMPLFQSPAPLLEKLDLSNVHRTEHRVCSKLIFAGSTPRLRYLKLEEICIPLASPIYTGLIHLDLVYIDFGSPVDGLLRALGACPQLEFLRLCGLQFSSDEPNSRPLLIDLPMLSSIHLTGVGYRMENLEDGGSILRTILASIDVPPAALLHIIQEAEEDIDIDWIASHAQRNLKNVGEIRMLFMVCDPAHADLYSFNGRATEGGPELLVFSTGPLTVPITHLPHSLSSRLETLKILAPRSGSSWDTDTMSMSTFTTMLSNLSNLKKLVFTTGYSCDSLLSALVVTPTSCICPQLEELYLSSDAPVSQRKILDVVMSRINPAYGQVGLRKLALPRFFIPKNVSQFNAYGIEVLRAHDPKEAQSSV
ncbi:hypothetical protein BOTBODRAFT_352292 [Botryobasidium botryosum FD-172 SS1]|uniref:F-box domain-containing protein n=1 Tax=Botryobasidium botryosum (strain FD-172 SS1) TaxID=930990 RepID=A0A067MEF7_BOTB1|nr:hypothetical protein BOTBODRAFT_352292 [Botryobasidium botryosum FD-172 SS1]